MITQSPNIRLDCRLSVALPAETSDAIERIAKAQKVTVPDFIRAAVSNELLRLGVPHTRLPPLRRR